MAGNVVEYILKITGGKSEKNIKQIANQLKLTQKQLTKVGSKGEKNLKKLSKNSKTATQSLKAMKKGLLGLTGIVTGLAESYLSLNKVLADNINEIVDASTRSGIAADKLAGLKLAAEGSGKSFSELTRGLDQLNVKMIDAQKGTGKSASAFNALGVNVTNSKGNLRSANAVFSDVIASLKNIESQSEKAALAQKIFGQSGRALLQSGAIEDLDSFIGKAKELGPALDENGIKKAAEFQRGMAEFKMASIGAIQKILEGLSGEKGIGPALSHLAEDLNNFAGGIGLFLGNMMDMFGGVSIWLDKIGSGITKLISDMGRIGDVTVADTIQSALAGFGGAGFENRINPQELQGDGITKHLENIKNADKNLEKLIAENEKNKTNLVEEGEKTRSAIRLKELDRLSRLIEEKQIKDIKSLNNISMQLFGLRGRQVVAGDDLAAIDLLIEKSKQLRVELNKPKEPITLFGSGGKGKGKGGVDDEIEKASTVFFFLRKYNESLKQIIKPTKIFERINVGKKLEKIRSEVQNINKEKPLFHDLEEDLNGVNEELTKLGQSTSEVALLRHQLHLLRNEAHKLEQTKLGINLTTDLIGLAGGDVLGGITGILEKTLTGKSLDLLGPVSGAIGGLVNFGSGLKQAADLAVEKREEQLGRSLSSKEREELEKKAMREKAVSDVNQFIMAIEIGIRMLPEVLLEVLPPLFIDLAARIVTALAQLPFKFAVALGKGVFNVGAKVAEFPRELMSSLADLFGIGSKRKGGRFLSGRSGMRFTGSQEGLAMLHRNEYVVPESGARPQAVNRIMNQQSNSGITINVTGEIVERDAVEELVRKIEQKFQSYGTMQSTLFAG